MSNHISRVQFPLVVNRRYGNVVSFGGVMKCRFGDERLYEFHDDDASERCFLCRADTRSLFIVRELKNRMMVHLCRDCLVERSSEYLLDNTRPWEEHR